MAASNIIAIKHIFYLLKTIVVSQTELCSIVAKNGLVITTQQKQCLTH